MNRKTKLLIIGAGPYGLAMAAWAKRAGVDHLVTGMPMQFWRRNMPRGMILRSGIDWHMDPAGEFTLERFAAEHQLDRAALEPMPLERFIQYADWFQQSVGIKTLPRSVASIERAGNRLRATLDNRDTIDAVNVVVAAGFRHFQFVPDEYARIFPSAHLTHTCDLVDMTRFAGKRCMIVGGRQSAFETAALLAEAGAAEVRVVHRHDTPRFEASDWSWVMPLVRRTEKESGWFRRQTEEERKAITHRFWCEGRLKLEPWLGPRINRREIVLHPNATPVSCTSDLDVTLSDGAEFATDHIILATGYKVDIAKLPYIQPLIGRLARTDGFPDLDERFQSNLIGLFFTSFAATRNFGPFFGFVVGCPAAANVIGPGLRTI